MGKKGGGGGGGGGGWFSAIKRVFTPGSKEKLPNESQKRTSKKDKRKGPGKASRHGEAGSYVPFFREPSSVETILGEAEREHRILFEPVERARTPPHKPSPRGPSSLKATASPRQPVSPRLVSVASVVSPGVFAHRNDAGNRLELTFRDHHVAATVIQAAYRGYVARRSFRALKGLVRLQEVVRGQNVKRQTANALKYLQLLVRVQSQIQSRRIQMLENQVPHQAQHRVNKDHDSTLSKWSQVSDAGNEDEWDDSLLTKEEIEARLHRKVEAIMKRERAMAYAHSNQLWKANSNSPMMGSADIRAVRFPWWWSWLDRRLPSTNPNEAHPQKNFQITPPRAISENKPSPWTPLSDYRTPQLIEFDNISSATPRSSRSVIPMPSTNLRTPSKTTNASKYSRSRANVVQSVNDDIPLKDDDSLTSCPPFSVPNYMTPTVSAKAKVRPGSNPRERFPKTPVTEGKKKRFSFALFSGKNSKSPGILDKRQPLHVVGNVSVDSTASLPAGVGAGRKPFNRFV